MMLPDDSTLTSFTGVVQVGIGSANQFAVRVVASDTYLSSLVLVLTCFRSDPVALNLYPDLLPQHHFHP
jgi:hypothetical protein